MSESFGLPWQEHASWQQLQQLKLDLVQSGKKVYDLGMINPDLEPARFLVDRLQEAVAKKLAHRYSVARGVAKLREALAERYNRKFGVKIDPDQNICICAGAKDALVQALFVLESWTQELLLPAPTYPSFISAGILLNKPCRYYQLADSPELLLENIRAAIVPGRRTVLIVNFPNNPTGQSVDQNFYNQLAEFCDPNYVRVINDFAYGELGFKAATKTAASAMESAQSKLPTSLLSTASFNEFGLEIYSMSKSFSIPGWRIGAVIGDAKLIAEISKLKSQTDFGLFLPIQWAAAAALAAPEDFSVSVAKEYAERFDLLSAVLKARGFEVSPAGAGCSLWAKIPEVLSSSGAEFARQLLEERGVLAMPGELFGSQYNQWLRFALVTPQAEIREAFRSF